MMAVVKHCSQCKNAPLEAELILPHSIDNPKAVVKFQIICTECVGKALNDSNLYFATFAWNTKALAISDWNDAVNNNNKKDGIA